MSTVEWVMAGLGLLALIGGANAWMMLLIKGIRDETKSDRHEFRGYLQREFSKFDVEQTTQDGAHSNLRERVAKLEMKVLGNGH